MHRPRSPETNILSTKLMEDVREFQNLQPGLATAPVLFASEECPQLLPLIQRHCTEPGDIELVSFMKVHKFLHWN